jgi:DNA-binding NtrC family response regulator
VPLIGESKALESVRFQISRVAPTPLPVLIHGETGTGKEVTARALHDASGRNGPFVPVDCAALSPQLVESELFGHERGAFTGANQAREGLVHAANHGTFFLDEIGELPMDVQSRLLRLLEQATYRPVGSQQERRADIRVIAATWRDLDARVSEGLFRRDLYHRLSVVELFLPPLRERGDDVEMLIGYFLDQAASDLGRPPPILEPQAMTHLLSWPWPGNIRELRNVTSYICAMTQGRRAGLRDLPPQILRSAPGGARLNAGTGIEPRTDLPYMEARREWLDEFQYRYVTSLLDENDGNVSATARAAGMDRRSIQRILTRARSRYRDT